VFKHQLRTLLITLLTKQSAYQFLFETLISSSRFFACARPHTSECVIKDNESLSNPLRPYDVLGNKPNAKG